VVEAGLAVTDDPVVADNPVAGLQEYVDAPLAVKVVAEPKQIVTAGLTVTVGKGLITTLTLPLTFAGQEGGVGYATLTKLYVALAVAFIVALPKLSSVIVRLGNAPFIL
jgi:hypothetical protein